MPLPFALDHINLWLLDGRRRLHARRLRLRRRGDARALGAAFRDDARAHGRSGASSRRTAIPTTSATPRGSPARFGVPVAMTHAEFLTAHAVADEHAGYALAPTRRALSPARHGRRSTSPRSAARGNRYRRGVPELPAVVRPHARRRRRGAPAARRGASSRATGTRPSTRRSIRAERGVLISGDMLLPRISTNVSVWPAEPDGDPLGALPRLARRRSRRCRPTRWCCRRTACRFAASPLRVAQLRAHHDARLAELDDAVARGARRRSARPTSCRCCSAASSTCSSASSRWARRSPISTTSGARAGSSAASPPTAPIRFAAASA